MENPDFLHFSEIICVGDALFSLDNNEGAEFESFISFSNFLEFSQEGISKRVFCDPSPLRKRAGALYFCQEQLTRGALRL